MLVEYLSVEVDMGEAVFGVIYFGEEEEGFFVGGHDVVDFSVLFGCFDVILLG